MQDDLDLNYPTLDISIIGVNDTAFASGNDSITDGRDLPWLQNTAEADVWNDWGVTYRDVWVLDGDNVPVGIFNVTASSLADTANYDTLKQMFLDAAAR
ncbi:MAG: hypothetical protein KDA24_10725 [Deltaproteobacteria bacterium]|nr:hypothetical protein [Deltaproteobacteria bacterium]